MMTNPTRIGATLLLIALLPAAALAQDAQQNPTEGHAQMGHTMDENHEPMAPGMMGAGMMMEGTMDMRMMSAMMGGPSPAAILKQSEALELAPDQVRDLDVLQNQERMGRESRMARMKTLHAQLTEVLSGDDVDAAAYETVLRSMADQQVTMHVQRLKIGQDALAVLSDGQREKLQSGHSMMGAEGMERRNCPMAGGEDEQGREI